MAMESEETLREQLAATLKELGKWERPFDQEKFDATKQQASHADSLSAQGVYIVALEHALKHALKAQRIAELKASGSLANNLCQDHRDKQANQPCLACSLEKALKAKEELRHSLDAFKKENQLLTHKIITCGVAAEHPNQELTKTGAYSEKWNSPQAEAVRKLRKAKAESERDAQRYRWLRDHQADWINDASVADGAWELDAAIDEAIHK